MRKFIKTATVLAAASALALTGCGRQGGSSSSSGGESKGFEKGSLIGVALPQKTSENWVLAEKLFKNDLESAGYKTDIQFANGGVAEQQNQISTMVSKGAKVIIVGAIDSKQLGTQLKQAKDAGATVIAYDRLVENTNDVDYYVAFNNYKVGELQGQALLEGLKKKGSGPYNVELMAGSPDDANSRKFFDGAMSKLKPAIESGEIKVQSGQKDFNQVVTQGWKAENAQKRFDTVLSGSYSSAKLDGVLSPNDTLARAVLTAVKSAGKPTPVITGQDSEVESVKLIMSGQQYSTISKDTRELVKQAVTMVNELQSEGKAKTNDDSSYNNGKKTVPAFLLKPVIVTKDNAAEVYKNDPTLSKIAK